MSLLSVLIHLIQFKNFLLKSKILKKKKCINYFVTHFCFGDVLWGTFHLCCPICLKKPGHGKFSTEIKLLEDTCHMWYLQSFRFELHMSLNNDPVVICTIRILSKFYCYSQLPKSSRLDKSDSEFKSGEIFIFLGESVEKYLHCNMKFSVQTFSICVSSELDLNHGA